MCRVRRESKSGVCSDCCVCVLMGLCSFVQYLCTKACFERHTEIHMHLYSICVCKCVLLLQPLFS